MLSLDPLRAQLRAHGLRGRNPAATGPLSGLFSRPLLVAAARRVLAAGPSEQDTPEHGVPLTR